MSVNLIRDLYRFMTVHYPRRLAQILVVRCNDTLTSEHEEQLKSIQKLCIFKDFSKSPLVKFVATQNLKEEFSGERIYYYLGDSLGRISDKR
jgi:hypothetical protein